jgi:hypothetical protein
MEIKWQKFVGVLLTVGDNLGECFQGPRSFPNIEIDPKIARK